MAKDSGTRKTRQTKTIITGGILVAWGIIGALISYYNDENSFDILRMMGASQNAIVHLVIWVTIGIGFILWGLAGRQSSRRSARIDKDRGK